jgi:mediator of RNA polymerase II transcription subunit 13, fungi type
MFSQSTSRTETLKKELARPLYIEDDAADCYALYPNIKLPLPARQIPRMTTPGPPFVPDSEDSPKMEERSVLPLSSVTLAKVSRTESMPSTTMLHVHLLHCTKRQDASSADVDQQILHDVILNYHELAALTRARYRLHARPVLPFHLAALEVIEHAFNLTDPSGTE